MAAAWNQIDLAILTAYITSAARNVTLKPLDSAVLSCPRGRHDTLRSFYLNSRVLHLSVIIWPAFLSRKLLSPHLPPLVPAAYLVATVVAVSFHNLVYRDVVMGMQ